VTRDTLVPSPICPAWFEPQQCSVPFDLRAHVLPGPTATEAQSVATPTATGVVRELVVPSPSWPTEFQPQHEIVPSVLRAQVWYEPALTVAQLVAVPI
jgi:hypothetical protein